jgi:ADP-ribose pyrophosphatase YjhB (NUDIX family)
VSDDAQERSISSDARLHRFLDRHQPLYESRASWTWRSAEPPCAVSSLPLRLCCYLSTELPALEYVSSVRAVVFSDDGRVLVMRNADSTHVLPGGRREPGETPEQTLRRELLEECGWRVEPREVLGFTHFRHLAPKPAGYPFPHPDFFWVIYRAHALSQVAGARDANDYERESWFAPPDDGLRWLVASEEQRTYLLAAIGTRVPRCDAKKNRSRRRA